MILVTHQVHFALETNKLLALKEVSVIVIAKMIIYI